MRAFLATSMGVACSAALVLPLSLPTGASAAPRSAPAGVAAVPGSTQSLPLVPLTSDRSSGTATEQGLAGREVRPFSLLGVVWDDADTELHGTVQVRTRATETQLWSAWQELETHNQEHGADLGTEERGASTVHGSTAPLWVGDSDGVEIRVRAAEEPGAEEAGPGRTVLPLGLRLELIDPGEQPGTVTPGGGAAGSPTGVMSPEDTASSAANEGLAELGATEITALSKAETEQQAGVAGSAAPFIGPRPRIVTRKGWGADESLREKAFGYTGSVKAAFVHHSATGNNYTCSQAPSVIRGIYRYHVVSNGWRDIGYNFAIDKCGNIYEGRAGGVAKAVMGAHTLGFNTNSTGIAVLGTFSTTNPPAAVTTAVAKLTAWKLGLYGVNPKGKVTLTSGGGNLYAKGTKVKLNAISGHRDGFNTECPGTRLYNKLGTTRTSSASLQGR